MDQFLQQLINGLAWGSIYALIALGYTMVYGVLRLINFAHGDVYMIGAMAAYYTARLIQVPSSALKFSLILMLSMAICGIVGVLIERLAYRPLRNAPKISVLITAIGVSFFIEYAGQSRFVFGPDPKVFPELIRVHSYALTSGVVLNNIQILIFTVSISLMILLRFFVMKTQIGRAMRAVAFSHQASAFVGINVSFVITMTFFIGSTLAGAAGVLVSLYSPQINPLVGAMPGLKAFVAAVLGGVGSIPGALLGGFLMGISETLVSAYVSSTYRDALAFILLILILLVRPNGLLGRSMKEKV